MRKQSIIICGSRQTNIDLSTIVDRFDVIVRHNKALPGCGYGHRDADVQILNRHVYENYRSRMTAEKLYAYYGSMGVSLDYLIKYCEYIYRLDQSKIVHYERNNQATIERIAIDNRLNITDQILSMKNRIINNDSLHVRCGMGHVAHCVSLKIKPWLIGYSIQESTLMAHCYNRKQPTGAHDAILEARLLREMHEKGLIDASLCSISTDGDLTGSLDMTTVAKKIHNDHIRRH